MRGGGTVAGEEPVDGLDIGFLVELGWASLIIAMGRTGQFALPLFSRMLKFLFLSGPVMYLKHMGTPATICPKSHNPSTFLTMCHLGGEQREGEEGGRDDPMAAERGSCQPPLQRGLQRKFQCRRTLCVSGALPPSVAGVGREETMCESRQESLPGSGWRILFV